MDVVTSTPDPATDVPEDGPVEVTPMLTPHDRCDQCQQETRVRVRLASGGTLDFCLHHYKGVEVTLALAGAVVLHDERHKLLVKPA